MQSERPSPGPGSPTRPSTPRSTYWPPKPGTEIPTTSSPSQQAGCSRPGAPSTDGSRTPQTAQTRTPPPYRGSRRSCVSPWPARVGRYSTRRPVFTVWYGKEGVLVGVLSHGSDEDYERGRGLIES